GVVRLLLAVSIVLLSANLSGFAGAVSYSAVRGPTRAPRFPYTTLFRSHGESAEQGPQQHLVRFVRFPSLSLRAVVGAPGALLVVDRKSTRLNSSHVKISYAVFCLKTNSWRRFACCWPCAESSTWLRSSA